MSTPRLPWEPSYVPPPIDTNLVKQITDVVEGAVAAGNQVVSEVVQDSGELVQNAESEIGAVTSALPPMGVPSVLPVPTSVSPDSDWVSAIEAQAKVAARAALPMIEGKIVSATTKALKDQLSQALGEPQVAVLPTGKELTKLDAWERAARTFIMGLVTTVLLAIITVVGQAASTGTVNFFTADGWQAVAVMGGGSVVTAIFSYLYRYLKEPDGAAINSSTKQP